MLIEAEEAGAYAYIGVIPFDEQENEEINACCAIGDKGSKPCSGSAHIKSPWKDEDRIQHNIKKASAHGTDAGVKGGALRTDQIRHDHIEDRRGCAEGNGPFQILRRGGNGLRACTKYREKRAAKQGVKKGKHKTAEYGTVKAEGGTTVYGIVVFFSQRPAHHAGGTHAEEIVYRVEG